MAANQFRGEKGNEVDVGGEASWFDLGTADMMVTCTSCHIGGGPFEGRVTAGDDINHPVITPWTSLNAAEDAASITDRDFYTWSGSDITNAFYGSDTITGALEGKLPEEVNWTASGIMEADCLMCHIDPESDARLLAADGLLADANRPRMMIFAERNGTGGTVSKVSLGAPLHTGFQNEVVRPYTDGLNRMSRPSGYVTDENGDYVIGPMGKIPLNVLAALPASNVGMMMQMWTGALKDITDGTNHFGLNDDGTGNPFPNETPLPYGLYGQNIAKIWGSWDAGADGTPGTMDDFPTSLKQEYSVNPDAADEMMRLGYHNNAIMALFNGFLGYLTDGANFPDFGGNAPLPPGSTMMDMMGMFFNDFIYGFQINSMMGAMPIPVSLHAFDEGKFYTNFDDFQASTRDYVRDPLIEGEGIPYSGRPGLAFDAMNFGMGLMMCGDMRYAGGIQGVDIEAIMNDWQANIILSGLPDCTPPGAEMSFAGGNGAPMQMLFGGAKHANLPSFFSTMASAELMGLDLNGNGAPLTYIQILKDDQSTATGVVATAGECNGQMVNTGWCAKTFYDVAELQIANIHNVIFGSRQQADDHRWTRVCGTCHVMVKDHGNSEVELVRKYNLGMSADFVKNGHFVNITDDVEAEGYDVHMSSQKLGCGSCHLMQDNYRGDNAKNDIAAMHNFLKGTDTAHMVRNDLDNKIPPKNCEGCHVGNTPDALDTVAADPKAKHIAAFGVNTGIHMEKIACQTCHVPYKKTWRFRAFDDTLGYFGNFDNRMGYDVLPASQTMAMMAYPAEYAISPVYGASPGYGIPHFNMVAQHLDANGAGQVPMDYVSEMVDYFHITKDGDPGQIVNGMPTNPRFDFWKYFYQMFFNGKVQGLQWDKDMVGPNGPDNKHFAPLYYANGTNGYPQIVIGNPITIMTWVDASAGDVDGDGVGEMDAISYGGAKIMYLREMMAAISEYYPPTNLGCMDPMTMYMIPANDADAAANGCVGRVVLKPTPTYEDGYVLFDHTGDMYPEMWHVKDVEAVQEAMTIALEATGRINPKPMIFLAAHYFSDTHGVKPANKALGANGSCNDCHGDMTTDSGAHRVTDRLINFLPWAPPWFNDAHRIDSAIGSADGDSTNDLFIVDAEIAYIDVVGGNGIAFVGSSQEDILDDSLHHANHLFYQHHGDEVSGDTIRGLLTRYMTAEETGRLYVPQVTKKRGDNSEQYWDFIPTALREHTSAFGFVPVSQKITIDLDGTTNESEANVFVYGLNASWVHNNHEAAKEGVIVILDQVEDRGGRTGRAAVVFQPAYVTDVHGDMILDVDGHPVPTPFDEPWVRIDGPVGTAKVNGAQLVQVRNDNHNRYILRAGPGRYAAVHLVEDVVNVSDNDLDGDGVTVAEGDCDDTNASVNPNAAEVCSNFIDDSCDDAIVSCADVDGDSDGQTPNEGDCNDSNATIYTGAPETCGDGIDQDCSGADLACTDIDADGHLAIADGGDDCNDNNSDMFPGNTEVCGDGVDQDCSGADLACAPEGAVSNGGLQWEAPTVDSRMIHGDAVSYCTDTFLGGGWSLPTEAQLATLVDSNNAPQIIDGMTVNTYTEGIMPPVDYSPYWTLTPSVSVGKHRVIDFQTGTATDYDTDGGFMNPEDSLYVRCVRTP